MKIKVSEATGPVLNYLVANASGYEPEKDVMLGGHLKNGWYIFNISKVNPNACMKLGGFKPSTDWSQGGPIIEREKIVFDTEHGNPWRARFGRAKITFDGRAHHYHHAEGPTPLIAAMRCYVASKLGDEFETKFTQIK